MSHTAHAAFAVVLCVSKPTWVGWDDPVRALAELVRQVLTALPLDRRHQLQLPDQDTARSPPRAAGWPRRSGQRSHRVRQNPGVPGTPH